MISLFRHNKGKGLLVTFLVVFIILRLVSYVYAAQNYDEPDTPQFAGNFASEPPPLPNTLTVVSYNIRYAQKIEQAIADLQELAGQAGADIILLQEMDEAGSEQIARALGYNFVYFPAAIEPLYKKNFGNAILSRWPISQPAKLILPHPNLVTGLNRTATRATITVQGVDVLVYGVHTETILTWPSYRQDQITAIMNDMAPEAELVIVGGDFNSSRQQDVDMLERLFSQAGLVRASAGIGYSYVKYGVEATIDHVFSKGLSVRAADKMVNATASDHLPIWVQFDWQPAPQQP